MIEGNLVYCNDCSSAGRNGTVSSNGLQLNIAFPKELGGSGKFQNLRGAVRHGIFSYRLAYHPFNADESPPACLLGAIQSVSKELGKEEVAKNAVINISVHLGEPTELKGFGLAVDIKVNMNSAHIAGAVVNISTA